jgi:RecA/RadA recombinase
VGRYLSTGNPKLDDLFGGGFLCGVTNCIYGDPGTGKTTLIMNTVLSNLDDDAKRKALIVDTESGWSVARISKMAEARGLDPQKALEHFQIYSVTELAAQHDAVMNKFEDDIKANGWKPVLFAVDSIAGIYHGQLLNTPIANLAGRARELQGKLSIQISRLLNLANKYETPAIIVTWIRSAAGESFDEKRQTDTLRAFLAGETGIDVEAGLGAWKYPLIGGQHLTYYSKVLVRLLSLESPEGDKLAILEKSIEQPSNRCLKYTIREGGFEANPTEQVRPLTDVIRELAEQSRAKQAEKRRGRGGRKRLEQEEGQVENEADRE